MSTLAPGAWMVTGQRGGRYVYPADYDLRQVLEAHLITDPFHGWSDIERAKDWDDENGHCYLRINATSPATVIWITRGV